MPTAWLTYAWADNDDGDVDFVVQELESRGLEVRADRWTLSAGQRLWEQIGANIEDPDVDAWILYTTPTSLASEPCREELAYALDRALHSRGAPFPLIAIVQGAFEREALPSALRVRLCVSTDDRDFAERVVAAAEGRAPDISRPSVHPYVIRIHHFETSKGPRFAIELRPRVGAWSPFIAAIPANEREAVAPSLYHGPAGRVAREAMLRRPARHEVDGWYGMAADNEATPTQSYYLHCSQLPSRLLFGVNGDASRQYTVVLTGD